MPELPEVETVCQGLIPAWEGATFSEVCAHRTDLRFPLPDGFAQFLTGAQVVALTRRGKYILAATDRGQTLISHLGMSGRFFVQGEADLAQFHRNVDMGPHVHLTFQSVGGAIGAATVSYADPRRFGYMDLVPTEGVETCKHFARMGPEPLSDGFSPAILLGALSGKRAPMKAALLDQSVVAGLGNIYVCEALYRAGISPRRQAQTVGAGRAERLYEAIRSVLEEAIVAGGSSLRDYAAADGTMGTFQHGFDVYDQEGKPCQACGAEVQRIVQSGRSTFFCGQCQR